MGRRREIVRRCAQIQRLIADDQYTVALEEIDALPMEEVESIEDLYLFASVYEKAERLDMTKNMYYMIYNRTHSKHILYRLLRLVIRLGELEEAGELLMAYEVVGGMTLDTYELRYRLSAAMGEPRSKLIEILENLKKEEYTEEWGYQLARLYEMEGEREKCIQECRDLKLWFGQGSIVDKAMALKERCEARDWEPPKDGTIPEPEEPDLEEIAYAQPPVGIMELEDAAPTAEATEKAISERKTATEEPSERETVEKEPYEAKASEKELSVREPSKRKTSSGSRGIRGKMRGKKRSGKASDDRSAGEILDGLLESMPVEGAQDRSLPPGGEVLGAGTADVLAFGEEPAMLDRKTAEAMMDGLLEGITTAKTPIEIEEDEVPAEFAMDERLEDMSARMRDASAADTLDGLLESMPDREVLDGLLEDASVAGTDIETAEGVLPEEISNEMSAEEMPSSLAEEWSAGQMPAEAVSESYATAPELKTPRREEPITPSGPRTIDVLEGVLDDEPEDISARGVRYYTLKRTIHQVRKNQGNAHFVFAGGEERITLAVAKRITKELNHQGYFSAQSIVKITAEKLNEIDLSGQMEKLRGGCVLITSAPELNKKAVSDILDVINEEEDRVVVMMAGAFDEMDCFLSIYPQLADRMKYKVRL